MTDGYLLSTSAEQDIEEVIAYIAHEDHSAAHDFVDALYDAFERLANNPSLGHAREDLTKHLV